MKNELEFRMKLNERFFDTESCVSREDVESLK